MITFILMVVFGGIGAVIGELAFDHAWIIGGILGALVGLALRLGAAEGIGDIVCDMVD